MAIAIFFVAHWQLSVFFQSFYLHRYGAHRQFTMSPFWDRAFFLMTFLAQGSSFLSPRGYGILHRMHHAFSDTRKDPHSPKFFSNPFAMMLATKKMYDDYAYYRAAPEPRFDGGLPSWPAIERLSQSWMSRVAFGAAYTIFYLHFATHWWMFLLLPFHWFLGPVHGAIVNYLGHKLGYRNYDSDDNSKNTLVFDVLTMGELFQNNHHKWGQSPNFAVRFFEIDPAYQIMKILHALRIIDMSGAQKARWVPRDRKAKQPAPLTLTAPSPMDGE